MDYKELEWEDMVDEVYYCVFDKILFTVDEVDEEKLKNLCELAVESWCAYDRQADIHYINILDFKDMCVEVLNKYKYD